MKFDIIKAKVYDIKPNEANETMPFFAETLPDIGFHTFSLMNSTYPSTIWDKSSASYAHALAKYSVSANTSTLVLVFHHNTPRIAHPWYFPTIYQILGSLDESISPTVIIQSKNTKKGQHGEINALFNFFILI
jgi:hypothetical protein